MRISGIGFAALTGGEHPDPGGQLRWHIDHQLTIGEQPLGDVFPDPVAALDRPRPISKLLTELEHRLVAGDVGGEPVATKNRFVAAVTSIVADLLCGSIPITTPAPIASSSTSQPVTGFELGGHRYFEQSKPFLSLSRSLERRPARAGQM